MQIRKNSVLNFTKFKKCIKKYEDKLNCETFEVYLPWNAISMSFIEGLGKFLSNVYMDMTIPGVQNPHCDP